jgi:phosphatidylglycerophosphatase A
LPIFVLFSHSFWGLACAWGALMAVGTWAAGEAERAFGREDDGRIVVDEIAGQLLALAPLLALPAPSRTSLFAVVTGFVAFRGFDIAKPGPVRWAERRFRGGLGVMADDTVAGALAAAVVAALAAGGAFA